MTILVLELKAPKQVTLAGFWALRDQFVAYFISFFWVGTMWVGLHNNWNDVKTIRHSTPWLAVILLFFSSLFPYATKIVSNHLMSFEVQTLYELVVIAVTVSNLFLYRSVIRTARRNRWLVWDIAIKCVALGLSALYPPTIMFVTLIAGVFWAVMSVKES